MRTSLSRRLLLSVGSLVILLLATTFLAMDRHQARVWEDYLISQSLSFARLATPELLKRFRGSFPPDEPAEMSGMYDFLALNRELIQFSLVSASGRRLYDSAVFPSFTDLDLQPFVEENLATRLAASRTTLVTRRLADGRRMLDLLEPAFGPTGGQILSVRYLISYDTVDLRMREVRAHFALVGAVAVIACLLLTGLLARRMARPIVDLTAGARALARGELETRIAVQSADELGVLARAFNDMAASLAASQTELTGKNAALSQAYAELQAVQSQLLSSERLAAIGQLAAGVSHEIDNPVGIILGHAELLREDLEPDDPRREDVQAIIDECRRCKRITGGLLGFARSSPARPEQVDLCVLLRDVVASLTPQRLFRHIRISLDLADTPVSVTGDADRLRQVLINLLLNAAQAMAGDGRIAIGLWGEAGQARLTIDDSGPGIAATDREQVFEPFYTTKPPGEGTGLGLAVCRKLLLEHAGDIGLDTSPAGGLRVLVHLPLAGSGAEVDSESSSAKSL
ncbi:MAG: ATP-binding protein [Desulfuromonadales bacterium]|nr:ATP-binding protein [Desulfuromonadales bacterium]